MTDESEWLESAVRGGTDWMLLAHAATERNGISGCFDLDRGWDPPYAETSGYSIPTLLRASRRLNDPRVDQVAFEVGRWLLSIQRDDGSFPGEMGVDGDPIVFDVGQILLGLLALHEATGDEPSERAARKAANWLCAAQDDDGAWRRDVFRGYANTYSSRVAWALAVAGHQLDEPTYADAAVRACEWIASHGRSSGWLDRMGFSEDELPTTHTIAYTLRGLLRVGTISGVPRLVDLAVRGAGCLSRARGAFHPLLPGEFSADFLPAANFACLTGDAQMVVVWLDAARVTGDQQLADRARVTGRRLHALQQANLGGRFETLGALPGSFPLDGGYEPRRFPNWATKFMVDAFLDLLDFQHEGRLAG